MNVASIVRLDRIDEAGEQRWHAIGAARGDSDDVDQSFRSHADQIGAKRRRPLSV